VSGALAAPFVAIVLTQVAVLATSIYLHRPLANRSLHLHPIADIAFRTILWLTTGQCRQEWVAVHRKQHTFIDREGDPHSPRLLGFWRVQVFNVNYVREARNPENPRHVRPRPPPRSHGPGALLARRARTSRGTRVLVRSDRLGPGLGAGLMHAVLYVFVMAPLINALGHWRGSRNFENTASNWRLLAWITGGESLHNNHHAHPRSAKFSVRRSEFDPAWLIIRSLAAVGLLAIQGPPIAWARAPARRSTP
jgi:stearoyl-CoA desaturase (Delta-9 desaturase)